MTKENPFSLITEGWTNVGFSNELLYGSLDECHWCDDEEDEGDGADSSTYTCYVANSDLMQEAVVSHYPIDDYIPKNKVLQPSFLERHPALPLREVARMWIQKERDPYQLDWDEITYWLIATGIIDRSSDQADEQVFYLKLDSEPIFDPEPAFFWTMLPELLPYGCS
ncbi:hypothetical protein H6P81_007794 [Aristolochia fimbriata]|uniref:Uncharacterized protein n=1 Tax=Aristolochia fimbriata TaxID=158543 RepID=A0AAV7F184_ARIFI|nr:hypothetical protein H6P81_007794 [Aristolochia fimbriata]